jgi:hypothetical protein
MATTQHAAGPQMSADKLLQLGIAVSSATRPNLVDAHKWFSLAALLGNEEAALCRKELLVEMSSAEVTAAQRAAREWMTRH